MGIKSGEKICKAKFSPSGFYGVQKEEFESCITF
jgi:hypothetical protein